MKVNAWSEKVIIPTYEIGLPEKNPIFLEKRVYQGSSGAVYPHPVIEKIANEKSDKEWLACYLENDFIKIMILPELGGRVQMAYDKVKERHFIYYNEVIKPALVGLTGPWISGGIEFNWPQHHRPSTYQGVDFTIEEHADGSKTVWCSEIERMFRTRGMAGFTLHPDKAYLEIRAKLFNRTSQPQTFLWWANPAVAVNDHYQSVFPPDVNAVFDHGKRDVSRFPIATGTYYKVDYSAGVDISRYKNIPVPTSYMAIKSKYDFVGGYENDSRGGVLHVANHHVSPGKKQWTWGNGDFGVAWDRNLTDANGPYIELMCGVYTDNQPDFSWIMPYEEKSFVQYFMPYQELGVVKNATRDAMLNMELVGEEINLKVFSTGIFTGATVRLLADGRVVSSEQFDFAPGKVYSMCRKVDLATNFQSYKAEVVAANGKMLVAWQPEPESIRPIPEAASPALAPEAIISNEELYLNGLHLEQYRHATFNAADYYREALHRDPADIRCNNALGMWFLRRGKFADAEHHFRLAYERLITRNPNPYDGEPLFNLGLALQFLGRTDEAYEMFYKSVWNAAWMDAGYFHIARIDAQRKNWAEALETIDRSLLRNWHNHKARHLKVAILRHLGESAGALALAAESLTIDKFNYGALFEQYQLGQAGALQQLQQLIRGNIHSYIEISLDYAWAGLYREAISLLDIGIKATTAPEPMALYYKAWIANSAGDEAQCLQTLAEAELCPADYCFPNQIESVPALTLAMQRKPKGARAPYYLGNFWYHSRQYSEALACWEISATNDNTFPTVHRNLALAFYNKFNQPERALQLLEKAFELNPSDARVLMELDQLYKKLNYTAEKRIAFLQQYPALVSSRDDLFIEWAGLHVKVGKYTDACQLVMGRQFHPWEGGEGKVTGTYVKSLIGKARRAIDEKQFAQAITWLEEAKVYPDNLGEGKLAGAQDNEIDYWLGCAAHGLGDVSLAQVCWQKASTGLSEPSAAWFYNDQQPDTIFFQGMAWLKLGNTSEAQRRFNKLINYGEKHLFDKVKIDYFAVSLPDLVIWDEDLNRRNQLHCYYLMALGHLGLGNSSKAEEFVYKIREMDLAHAGANCLEFL